LDYPSGADLRSAGWRSLRLRAGPEVPATGRPEFCPTAPQWPKREFLSLFQEQAYLTSDFAAGNRGETQSERHLSHGGQQPLLEIPPDIELSARFEHGYAITAPKRNHFLQCFQVQEV